MINNNINLKSENELIDIALNNEWCIYDVLSYYTGNSGLPHIISKLRINGNLNEWSTKFNCSTRELIDIIKQSINDSANFQVYRMLDNKLVKCTFNLNGHRIYLQLRVKRAGKNENTYRKHMCKINESKQVGTLYHVCTIGAYLDYILPNDSLSASGKYMNWLYGSNMYVSFTRDKRFVVETDAVKDSDILVQLVIDGDKLSENYKVGSYNDFAYDLEGNYIGDGELIEYREKEEAVLGPIKNVSKYIKHVYIDAMDINESSISDLEDLVELNQDAKYYNFIDGKSQSLKQFIKTCGLENGDKASDALLVFKEYFT